ncbi:uncharacterized protein LOC118452794 isoform X4 [Egretta garzetta]|uniref:uncharacterized protein LOC118452794 isoform X4 n=1 Tax=Egretta garzetta TaxID=188379 RepID=UPI00163C9C95|nr:uncharacterized protein LOC118452794 isoform X4 [Egretta garzetta]
MKMCKTVPVFILLFTGYICNNRDVAANTTTSSYSVSPASSVTQAPELETPQHGNNHIPENHPLAAPTVAGISISFVFICMLITIGICCAQRKSKGFSAESNSAPSGEPEVSLKKISTHENQLVEALSMVISTQQPCYLVVWTHMDFNNQMQCKLRMHTISLSERPWS